MTRKTLPVLGAWLGALLLVGALPGCGKDAPPPPAGFGTLQGKILDPDGKAVGKASIKVGLLTATSDFQGKYEVQAVPAGNATLEVTADWFADKQQQVVVQADVVNAQDVTLAGKPLQLLAGDVSIADAYNQTFDWTTDKLSVSVVAKPTRANVDLALYWRNPALYRAGGTTITPQSPPTIDGSGASGFDFPITSGAPNAGQQALDDSTIVDAISQTPLTSAEQESPVLWEPAVKLFLLKKDPTLAQNLYYVGLAVQSQKWGATTSQAPQIIEHTYLHEGELWVKVVFQDWMAVGAGISDTDGDGLKEVFARVGSQHVDSSLYGILVDQYVTPTFSTLELKRDLATILDDLYTRTSPSVVSVIGQPYEVPNHGTLQYPFVVLRHANSVVNVLLVAP